MTPTRVHFVNGTVVTPGKLLDGATITVADGRIASIDPPADVGLSIDLHGGWLVPGFIDTQVNGGGGVLLNDTPNVEGIAAIGAAHARFGTTAFLPTLISDTPHAIGAALDAVDAAIAAGVPGSWACISRGPGSRPRARASTIRRPFVRWTTR